MQRTHGWNGFGRKEIRVCEGEIRSEEIMTLIDYGEEMHFPLRRAGA